MLGSAVVPALERCGHEVTGTDIRPGWRQLDVRDRDEVRCAVEAVAPGLIIHLAAETSLEACEQDPDHGWATNALGAENIAGAASKAGAAVAYQILDVLHLAEQVELVTVGSGYFRAQFPVARPRSEVLRNAALERLGLNVMRPWAHALTDYLHRDFASLIRAPVSGVPR